MTQRKPTDSSPPRTRQIDRFRDAARELGADIPEEAFDAAVKKVMTAKPPKDGAAEPKGRTRPKHATEK